MFKKKKRKKYKVHEIEVGKQIEAKAVKGLKPYAKESGL